MPLADLRVVEMSTGIAGAYTTKLFADAGAEVVKIEPPGGDPLRRAFPPGVSAPRADSALFRYLCAGKHSMVGRPGDDTVRDLVGRADIVVEDLAADELERCGLLDEAGLVLVSLTPFGRTGPWARIAAAIMGNAAFFEPAAITVPQRGDDPSTSK